MATQSPNALPAWGEVYFDIARTLGAYRLVSEGDSRDDAKICFDWANDFQAAFEKKTAEGLEPGETYFEDVEAFTLAKAREHGYMDEEDAAAHLETKAMRAQIP